MDQANPLEPGMSTGQRIRYYRNRRGLTRAVLGELVGKSGEWVKAVETGRLLPPRLDMLMQLAEVLKVTDLADLTGEQPVRIRMFRGPALGHPALPAVKEAINWYPFGRDQEPAPLDGLQDRLTNAWQARHAAPDHRTVLGRVLPDLIKDAQYATHVYEGNERRRAQAILAEVLNLSQMFLAYQPCADLLWRVADRAMVSAHDSGDPVAMTGAVWFLGQAQRDSGDFDAAQVVTSDSIRSFEPLLADGPVDLLAMWGALQFEMAYTAARMGQSGVAWGHWDTAHEVSQRLPRDYYHRWTSFSRVIMGAHAVTIDVELRHSGEAIRHARQMDPANIPSQPRRGRHLIEVARGHHLRRDYEATLQTLLAAHATAPETIRFNGYARHMTLEILDSQPSLRATTNDLAAKIGLLQ